MKQILGIAVLIMAAMILSGCSTVQTAENFNNQVFFTDNKGTSVQPIAHVNVRLTGCYLLFIPLWAGGPEKDGDFELFSNTVMVKNGMNLLTKKAKEIGANRVIEVRSEFSEKPAWMLLSLITVKEVQVSATCTK